MPERFGQFLKMRREEAGMSQRDLADKLKVDRGFISVLETKGNPVFSTVLQVVRAMSMSLEAFFKEEAPKAPEPEIIVDMGSLRGKMAEESVKKNRAIPVLGDIDAIVAGRITTDTVEYFITVPSMILDAASDHRIIGVDLKGKRHMQMVVDLDDTELRHRSSYLVLTNHGLERLQAFSSEDGVVFERFDEVDDRDRFLIYRPHPKAKIPKVMGRTLVSCEVCIVP